MMSLLFAFAIAAAPDAQPQLPRHLTLGARTVAIADAFHLVPDVERSGAGVGAFAGVQVLELLEMRGGLELRSVEEGMGFCLEKCGLTDVERPLRASRQFKLVPSLDLQVRLIEIGPFTGLISMGVAISTSITPNDLFTIGYVQGQGIGIDVDLDDGWSFQTRVRWEFGMHHVESMPAAGHTSAYVVDASFVYRFSDSF